jgi:[protein-PII] uridylyltransferase
VRVARRLGLDATATHTLRLLIEHHLLMASISQRRDLDDPAVIRMVAGKLQTPEHVRLLTLHTFVDAQATSDKLWNGFKDSLLWSLHNRTLALMTGATEFQRAEEKQRELLLGEVLREKHANLSEEEVHAHFASLPARYFQIHPARAILEDLVLAHLFMHLQLAEEDTALAPVVNWRNDPDRGFTAVKICTWDRAGLFRKIAGSLSAAGLNILSAQIFTRVDGIVLDTFYVTDARSGTLGTSEQRTRFEAVLGQALVDGVDFHSLIATQQNARPLYQAYAGERIPIDVRFDNESSDDRTLIEIETEDRVGLLYYISEALTELELDIAGAKISTERGAAIDTFYVRELDGSRVDNKPRRDAIERKIRATLSRLDRVK